MTLIVARKPAGETRDQRRRRGFAHRASGQQLQKFEPALLGTSDRDIDDPAEMYSVRGALDALGYTYSCRSVKLKTKGSGKGNGRQPWRTPAFVVNHRILIEISVGTDDAHQAAIESIERCYGLTVVNLTIELVRQLETDPDVLRQLIRKALSRQGSLAGKFYKALEAAENETAGRRRRHLRDAQTGNTKLRHKASGGQGANPHGPQPVRPARPERRYDPVHPPGSTRVEFGTTFIFSNAL